MICLGTGASAATHIFALGCSAALTLSSHPTPLHSPANSMLGSSSWAAESGNAHTLPCSACSLHGSVPQPSLHTNGHWQLSFLLGGAGHLSVPCPLPLQVKAKLWHMGDEIPLVSH